MPREKKAKSTGPVTVEATVTGLGGAQFRIVGCCIADVLEAIKACQVGAVDQAGAVPQVAEKPAGPVNQ